MTSVPPPSLEDSDPPSRTPGRGTTAGAEARGGADAWPAWIGAAALIGALFAVSLLGLIIALAWTGGDVKHIPPGALQTTTYVQEACFIGVAFFFAGLFARPRGVDFGLVSTRFWRAARLAAGVGVAFYGLSAAWIAAIGIKAKDDVTDLGLDDSTLLTVTGVILLIVLAPLAEEILFRGLIFRGLRNRVGVWPAALMTGGLFGLVHATSSPPAFLVPLAILGIGLCLLYHHTGSLYPCIALHSVNNSLAVGSLQGWDWQIPLLMAGSVIAGVALAMTLSRLLGNGSGAVPAPAPAG